MSQKVVVNSWIQLYFSNASLTAEKCSNHGSLFKRTVCNLTNGHGHEVMIHNHFKVFILEVDEDAEKTSINAFYVYRCVLVAFPIRWSAMHKEGRQYG